jgi:tetratricopeptide (TPR) repeat protein
MVGDTASAEGLDAAVAAGLAALPPELAPERVAELWHEAKGAHPADRRAVRRFAVRLSRDRRIEALSAMLRHLAGRLRDEPWPLAFAAEFAVENELYAEALELARTLRARFPDEPDGYKMGLQAAVALRDVPAAAEMVHRLPEALMDENWARRGAILVAMDRQDYAAALEDAETLIKRTPKRPDGTVAAAEALAALGRVDEAEALIAPALATHPRSSAVLRVAASVADLRDDFDAALERWAELRRSSRQDPAGYLGALATLRRAKRMDLAMAIIYEAVARFPDNEEVLTTAARAAEQARQVENAELFWSRLAKLRPDNPKYAHHAAVTLLGTPAARGRRLPEVAVRLEALHRRFPDYAPSWIAHLSVLREMHEFAAAERLAREAAERFPDDAHIALAGVSLLEDQERFDSALQAVTALRAAHRPRVDIEAAYVRALCAAGRYDEADAVCQAAREKFPTHRKLVSESARIATRRGDWPEALRRLEEAQRLMPDDEGLEREVQKVRRHLAEPAQNAPADVDTTPLARFESLGGTGNGCEFGIIQRQLGSDRLGLLRWSRHDVGELIDGLEAEYEGVGQEDTTILRTVRVGLNHEEYVTRDKRYFMESHTFVSTKDIPADKMLAQTCRRLRFLRGKLLEDLRSGERIFVYKAQTPLTDEQIVSLHDAVRRYGDNAVLCVMRADAAHKRATLRTLGRGLYVGYVSHFMNDDSGAAGLDVTAWQAICREAEARWMAAKDAVSAAA